MPESGKVLSGREKNDIQKTMTRSVLFDMDGVILDSMSYHVRAWQEALSEHGFSVSTELLYLHEGAIEPDTAAAIFNDSGRSVDADMFRDILDRQMQIFAASYQSMVKPFPEVPQMLERLRKAGWQLALVTSSHAEILNKVLPSEIRSCMDHIVTGDQVNKRKPFPDPFLTALSALGQGPEACFAVENSPAGIMAAKAAGLHCVALTTTLSEEHLSGADIVLNSHAELIDYINRVE
ncbi:MAG: HAD family phosphatase [Deltaproteobacteria bacterium]|nr:MAG: HAD family phosphatase [Deltaproteobacteria bacterium]